VVALYAMKKIVEFIMYNEIVLTNVSYYLKSYEPTLIVENGDQVLYFGIEMIGVCTTLKQDAILNTSKFC
jgi:hypothetical protein